MQVTTGFGYYVQGGNIIAKYELSIGQHPDPPADITVVEVADKAALDAVKVYTAPLTPIQAFSVDKFVEQLMIAFQADAGMLPYYAVIKDLCLFRNFYGLNILINGLLSAGKITSDEANKFNQVLANQKIVLSSFTTPPA